MARISLPWFLTGTLAVLAAGWLIGSFGFLGFTVVAAMALMVLVAPLILRRPQIGLLLVLFFLPFERIPSLDIGGITLRINFLLGGLTLLSTLLFWIRGKLRPTKHPLLFPTLLLILAGAVSLTAAVESFRGIVVLGFIIFTAGFLWFTVELLRTPADWTQAVKVIWWSSLVVGLFGLYQFLGDIVGLPTALTGLDKGYTKIVFGFPRIQAFSVEPLYLGNWMLLPLTLLATTLLLKPKPLYRPALWWLFGLLCLVFVLTLSRGAYLAAIVAVGVIVLTLPRETFHPRHLVAGALIGVTVLAGAVWFITRGDGGSLSEPAALERFTTHAQVGDFGQSDSTQGRLNAFGIAYLAWRDHPVTGVGLGNYGAYSKQYPNPALADIDDIVNNQYLELLAETGLLGLIAFLLIFGVLVVRGVMAYRVTTDPALRAGLVAMLATLAGLAVQYNFFSTLYIIHVWVFFGLTVVVQTIALQAAQRHLP